MSVWRNTKTFFPLFMAELEADETIRSVAVVGAADGKFVVPLVEAGYRVTAIDVNASGLFGQSAAHGHPAERYAVSLQDRLDQLDIRDQVDLVHGDIRDWRLKPHDALWTSCSWHYSLNLDRPLSAFLDALKRTVRAAGLLGAEYFLPVMAEHERSPFYVTPEEVWCYFRGWHRRWVACTAPFDEGPHLGQPRPHLHRMGLLVAQAPDGPGTATTSVISSPPASPRTGAHG